MKKRDGFTGERALVLPASVVREMESDLLSSMLHITDIGYYPKAQNHFRERKEPISQYVLIYCVEGRGWFKVGEEVQTVAKNQCFILPAFLPHSYGSEEKEPWTIYWAHFKGKLADRYASYLLKPKDINLSIYSRISGRLDMFEEIYHTFEMGYSRENLLYACSTFHHFLGTLCYLQQYRSAVDTKNSEEDMVSATIHYMRENIEKRVTLAEIASHVGYSASHFSSVFNARTGQSPLNYFNQLKIQRACQLLDFSDIKINQVCFKIGIDDCYYFSRLFSKVMGISPRDYRKQKKG